jgi:hypothetical protein
VERRADSWGLHFSTILFNIVERSLETSS